MGSAFMCFLDFLKEEKKALKKLKTTMEFISILIHFRTDRDSYDLALVLIALLETQLVTAIRKEVEPE